MAVTATDPIKIILFAILLPPVGVFLGPAISG
jgi:uncharacterized membrane protein YqaE (UPF0057 family)